MHRLWLQLLVKDSDWPLAARWETYCKSDDVAATGTVDAVSPGTDVRGTISSIRLLHQSLFSALSLHALVNGMTAWPHDLRTYADDYVARLLASVVFKTCGARDGEMPSWPAVHVLVC